MRVQCLLSLSTLTKIAGVAALFGYVDVRTVRSMLVTIAVLGVHMAETHGSELMDYCEIDQSRIDLSTLLHILIPGALLLLLWETPPNSASVDASFRWTLVAGAVYLALMLAGVTSNYGLRPTDFLCYAAGYVGMNFFLLHYVLG
jgi:hypothetical protein